MKLWKRNAVVAAIVLFVCVAVYLNWSYDQGSSVNGVNSITNTTTEKNLGEAALVNSDSALELEDSSAEGNSSASSETSASEDAKKTSGTTDIQSSDDYFATARLNREEARDNSLAILQKTVDDPEASQEAINSASESITAMASATLQESKIESLITAKGYEDCVAFIGDNSVSVVVKAKSDTLASADVAKITDIVVGETKFAASDVKVIAADS
ncbi:MAG: SpoIIIAH-like family protein [Candidatus Onthomonas sp.]|nr:SpoIIIAH-like family protein [Candidatus Onthomonas sp.]